MKVRKPPKCWICKDEGIIIYEKNNCEYGCRCSCKKGMESSDRIATIGQEHAEILALENYEKYAKYVEV